MRSSLGGRWVSHHPANGRMTTSTISPAVERTIDRTRSQIRDPELAWLFSNCFPNTLDTTITTGKDDTFVITGDIDAMWLRDSTAQVWPYLSLLREDDGLRRMIAGI